MGHARLPELRPAGCPWPLFAWLLNRYWRIPLTTRRTTEFPVEHEQSQRIVTPFLISGRTSPLLDDFAIDRSAH